MGKFSLVIIAIGIALVLGTAVLVTHFQSAASRYFGA